MKIKTTIGKKDYIFELDRQHYKEMLQDEEYSKIQNEYAKKAKDGNLEDTATDNVSDIMLNNLILNEKVFYYSLKKNQPDITKEESSKILDELIEEDGCTDYLDALSGELLKCFTPGTTDGKKTRVLKKM